jgi:D-inositol-3-phosphate glycosyltransferase
MCVRVAMLSYHTSPLARLGRTLDAGGMNVYIRGLASELGRVGIAVDVFTRRSSPEQPMIQQLDRRVRLITLPAGPDRLLPPTELFPYVDEFTRRVAHFAACDARAGHGYDLVHSHYWLSAVAGAVLAEEWDAPHATMFHTVELLKRQQYGGGALTPAGAIRIEHEARIAREADRIIVSTEHEREQLAALYGLARRRLRIIPCGVDLRAFTPGTPAERQAAREALAPDGSPLLLFVGRLDPIKGLDLLLESVALLRAPARLIVVGGSPDGDPEIERLRGVAAGLGLGERVSFPGAVGQGELVRYYRAADALAVTSRYESFGLAAVEALACGTPVVASQAGGLPSIVREGENGLLVRWRSPQAFAERIDELLGDADLRARLAPNARASVERLDWRSIGNDVRLMYAQLLAAQRAEVAACSCF